MTGGREGPVIAPTSATSLGKSGWVVVGTLMLATVLANIASVCMFPQMVALAEEFGRPVNEVVWATAAFHVVATGVGGVAAALGATLGNRRMLTVTLALLLVGSLIAALTTSLTLLVVGRIIQGGAMAVQALAIGIIASYWRGEAMRRAISMIVLAMGLGAVVAYLLSGLIWRTGGNWRTLFWILAGASAVDLFLTLGYIKETKRTKGVRADYVGCVGLVAWAVLLLLPLSQANSWGWNSEKLLGLLLPGIAVLALWVFWELRCSAPLINLRVLKRMGVWQGGVVWLSIAIGLVIPAAAMPYLFQTPVASGFGFGKSLFEVSLALAVSAAVMAFVSALATPVMRTLTAKWTMLLGVSFGLAGFGLAYAHGSMWLTLLWVAATGMPPALAGSASYTVAAEAVLPEEGILVSTIYNTAAGLGSSIASAVVGYVLTIREVAVEVATPDGSESAFFPADQTYTWSALIIGGIAVSGMLAVLTIRQKHLRAAARASDVATVRAHN
ncbi:MAG: MFS transporter [Actinobacteria bacterium]|nr:MFS transporter [Actinomycetota bacterium]